MGLYSPYGNFEGIESVYQLMYNLYLNIDGDLFRCDYDVAYAHEKECIDAMEELYNSLKKNFEWIEDLLKNNKDDVPFPIQLTFDYYAKSIDLFEYVFGLEEIVKAKARYGKSKTNEMNEETYISIERTKELKLIQHKNYDLNKLVRLVEELNLSWRHQNYYSVGLLLRTIINHIPPIFNAKTFDQVIAEIPNTKNFKKTFTHLNNCLREIADNHTHQMIRQKEVLPNKQQVDYKSDLDVLISEIIIKLHT